MENKLYNLTAPQKSIWNTELFFNGSNINNICGTINLYEQIDFDILKKSLDLIISKNDNFHINFIIKDGDVFQYFKDEIEYKIDIIDITNEEELHELEKNTMSHIFDILNSDLFNIKIFRYPDLTGGVIFNIHHIISDSWTLGLIAKEIVSNYYLLSNNTKIEPKNYSYIDYIDSEKKYINSQKYIKDKEFWSNYLENRPESVTIPNNINSFNNHFSSSANRKLFELDNKYINKINNFCKEYNISLFCFFMAIYSIYISKVNNLNDFILGTPILNRTNIAQKNTMGMFINTIPIRIKIEDNSNIIDFLNGLSLNLTSILRHQKHSYQHILEDLRKEDPKIPNLYQVLLSYQITKIGTDEYIKHSSEWNFNENIADDIDIHFFDLNDSGNINIAYDYRTSKYTDKDISNIHSRILHIITQITNDSNITINEISITTPKELKEILALCNKENCSYPKNKTISQLFEEQVKLTPNNIAVKFKDKYLTYDELNKKANQVANFLRSLNIKANDVVALRLNKSLEMVIGILGILKAGGCYLPIDLSYPQERVSFMLKDSNAKLFLTNEAHKHDLDINIPCYLLDISSNNKIYSNSDNNLKCINSPEDLIYIIYTSGSTGTPKGVMLCHRNVVRLIKNEDFQFDFNEKDTWTMFHSVAFDFSVWELYACLLYGSKLILVPEPTAKDPTKFLQLLRDEKITVLNQTPTYFYNLMDMELLNADSSLCIRYIIFGGEALKPLLVKPWKEKYPSTKIINMYGITETTVHVTYKELKDSDLLLEDSNIGKPIPTLKVYVMDKNSNIVPYGVEGEMCVSGLGVCKGYLNRPELNNKKFIQNPYNPDEILYRSADTAILSDSGDLYYLGRIDNQVKIRGFRIEIGEIETKLLKHPDISKCVVLPKKNGDTDSYLVAYIVSNKKISSNELKLYISKLVPEYMIPSFFVFLDKIPLTSNGKVDRKKLLNISIKTESNTKYVAPRNDFEKTFQKVLEKSLNASHLGIDDNILELGADSLTLMRITIELLEKNYIVNIQDIYEFKTIRNISDNFAYPKKSNIYQSSIADKLYYNFEENFSKEKIKANNILLTGSTGFLGIHILYELLNNTDSDIYCLIRSKNNQDSKDRLINKLTFYFGQDILKYIDKRIHVIVADISLHQFGLNNKQYKELGNKIDLVIHSAAIVDHYGNNDLFESINVNGTVNIIEFCKEFSIYMNHISTTSVSASIQDIENPIKFDEHTLYIGQNYYDNIYIRTKFKAEYKVWEAINLGMNISIYRLGNITARYSDGRFQENYDKNAFLNRIITTSKLKKIPESFSSIEIDLSPVDICSKIITSSIYYKSSYKKVFHIYNNNYFKFIDLINFLRKPNKEINLVSDEEFYKYIKNKSDILGIINDLTSNSSKYNSNINMNNDFTINYMKNLNLTWPKIDENYLTKFLKKYTK